MTTESIKQIRAFKKTSRVIDSCTKARHLPTAKRMIINFWYLFKDADLYESLYGIYLEKKLKFNL